MQGYLTHLHRFNEDITAIQLPDAFTYPFFYEPHPLSMLAAEQVQQYLTAQTDFQHNFGLKPDMPGLVIGKMFGVLVVQDQEGKLGYLAAVSGKLAGTNQNQYFVPPIFDMLDPDGFFIQEENIINAINRRIEELSANPNIKIFKERLVSLQQENDAVLSDLRKFHKANKAERKRIREQAKQQLNEEEYNLIAEDLIKQSYRDQHDYDVAKQACKEKFQRQEEELQQLVQEIDNLKDERKRRSADLQQRLFDQYHFLNAEGNTKPVLDIFQDHINMPPPAGAGECAAPKLLQYAYQHQLKPIALAEFWWGASPSSEVRKHKQYYPSCRGKCEPILGHMLQGLKVDPNPMLQNPAADKELEFIYKDDDIIVVNKPAEFLSVPGINIQDSVQQRIERMYPDIKSPIIIHRLDMSTSGILVLAKNKEAHQIIQDQFIQHTVRKRYTALLEGIIEESEGLIDLPLRVDLDDRPRQMVCYDYGKPARTEFKVVAIEGNRTRIHYFPLTGRTHQLRVHSAHVKGLNAPIVGDDLYGNRADRLHLHAGFISFKHPKTGEVMSFEVTDPF
ncbi:pseudouridine synthase [Sphingobacterium sp. BN32]|uniref:RluA family pseudouridine synthase n=1 Tax=Sphingobacterium sp. BN32 TaxID=3058432 RepID=UPI00265CE02F|nr:pseudouridine synthase [Sphingobacterium sp. BN32]WKK60256.1 pseudouridine synthase [Sphingobacterium sp. BN32]